MADEFSTPAPTPGGNYAEEGGKKCQDKPYFISVCDSGECDPVLRHTIVEAAATLNDCEYCVTCEEVASLIAQMEALMDSKYEMDGGSDHTGSSQTSSYQDVTNWSESSSNSDYSLSGGSTMTMNTSGKCSMKATVSLRSPGGSSSCSVRMVLKSSGETSFTEIPGTTTTANTDTTSTSVTLSLVVDVDSGDEFKVQYKNNDPGKNHIIVASESSWTASLKSSDLGLFGGSIISDNVDIKTALKELESAIEPLLP